MTRLSKPGILILSLFSILTTISILFAFYWFSLPFFNMWTGEVVMYILIPLLSLLVTSILIDRTFDTQFKRYSLLSLILFIFCLVLFPTVKSWIIKDSERRGAILVQAIKAYKAKFGRLPNSLEDSYFDSYNKSALIARPFYYFIEKSEIKDSSFVIFCYSFDGMKASLTSNSTTWVYTD